MMKRVALTMRVTEEVRYQETRDSISHDWLARLGQWDMTPFVIPNVPCDPETYLDYLSPDLLVLTGGDNPGDFEPRDKIEERIFLHALRTNIPVLGICRGMQFINLYFGGSLTKVDGHVGKSHNVFVEPVWQSCYGKEMTVNSHHRVGIATGDLGKGLTAAVFVENDHVEALYHKSYPVIAFMWHPERSGAPVGDRKLVARLIEERAFWA
ncbi:MAG TPA: gamma-glutamyl-gamma-aminobutyrate hydrolase family protein [Rhodospirillales bacterium]|jgi:putative glutamine amidotransferase|nr:gamma-glutamyl-gamma-aminobutyrate hydrolase family protein [Rhodospirillales bacterium]